MTKKEDMEKIASLVDKCKKCSLYKTRNKPVFGEGSLDSKILLIGEAPGKNEDLQGKPFVGRAGKILDELLESIGLHRSEVYITNILKDRPPKNRNPLKNEIKACIQYLDKQIKIINPKIIAPLGNFASSYIFQKFGLKYEKISSVHGKLFQTHTIFGNISIIPLYHPAIATYNPKKREILLEDLESNKRFIQEISAIK